MVSAGTGDGLDRLLDRLAAACRKGRICIPTTT